MCIYFLGTPGIYIYIYIYIYVFLYSTENRIAQLAGAVEDTGFFSAGGKMPTMSVLDMTLNNLMGRLEFWECGEPIHCHHSLVNSGPVWSQMLGSYLWVK